MAITAVNYRPHIWSPAYNPIVWSFISNQNTQPDFTYVVDLYINGAVTRTYRIKQRPNPSGVCMVDVSSILQPYIDLALYAAEDGWSLRYRNSNEVLATVLIKVGEEYSVNGALTIFNGSGVVGAPAYSIGAKENNSKPVRVTPAALPYRQSIENMASTTDYYYWSDYLMDGNGKFLKYDDNTIDVYSYDRHTLYFLNWNDLGAGYNNGVQLTQIKEYNSSNALIATQDFQNTTGNGGGPQTAANYTTLTESRATDQLAVRVGPEDLSLNPSTAYYTVTLFVKASATTSTTPGATASETVRFNIVDPCNDLYPRVRLSWLNSLGGRDYYNFTMFFEKTTDSPGEVYQQTDLNWSGTTPVALSSAADKTANWLRGGDKSFNKVVNTVYKIESDWITQAEMDFLGAIPESPQVWAYIGQDPEPYTVQISNLSYTYKLIKQVKLAQASFDMRFTKIQPKQNT